MCFEIQPSGLANHFHFDHHRTLNRFELFQLKNERFAINHQSYDLLLSSSVRRMLLFVLSLIGVHPFCLNVSPVRLPHYKLDRLRLIQISRCSPGSSLLSTSFALDSIDFQSHSADIICHLVPPLVSLSLSLPPSIICSLL